MSAAWAGQLETYLNTTQERFIRKYKEMLEFSFHSTCYFLPF